MKNTEKQGEHFCLHFLRGCAILLYTDECISPHAIVAQLDRAFGSDPEGQRFESSRSHQEKPRHIVPGLFFFVRLGGFEQQRRRPLPAAETGMSCWGRILIFQSPAKGLRKNQQMQLVRPHPKGGVSNQPSGLLLSARFPTGRNVYQQAAFCPENRKKLLRVRPGGFGQGAISDNFRRSRLLRGCGGRSRGWVQGRADRPDTR